MAGDIALADISLRERERAFLAGGTQVGKSTLADFLREDFLARYRARRARCLLLDTKPRYRAQWLPNGMGARRRYKKWDHGAAVPDSVLATTPDEMRDGFKLGHRTVIAQANTAAEIPGLVAIAQAFIEDSRRGRPQILQVDETKDFFHGNGAAIAGDAVSRSARAGSERGTAGLYCSQRTKGISQELMEHMSKLYAFRLDNVEDAKRFREFGCPIGPEDLPTEPYLFKYWTKLDYHKVWGPFILERPTL